MINPISSLLLTATEPGFIPVAYTIEDHDQVFPKCVRTVRARASFIHLQRA